MKIKKDILIKVIFWITKKLSFPIGLFLFHIFYCYDHAEELRKVLERLFRENSIDYVEGNKTHKGLVTIGMCALMRSNNPYTRTPLLTFSCLLTRLHCLKLYGFIFGSENVTTKKIKFLFLFIFCMFLTCYFLKLLKEDDLKCVKNFVIESCRLIDSRSQEKINELDQSNPSTTEKKAEMEAAVNFEIYRALENIYPNVSPQ